MRRRPSSSPRSSTTAFPDTPASAFWTTNSAPVLAPQNSWYVYFSDGLVGLDSAINANVRCVRAGAEASPTRYTVAGGTVHDNNTKLTWQLTPPSTTFAWPDAQVFCASTAVSGALGGSAWRVPTVKELLTLVDFSRSNPSIDPTASLVLLNDAAASAWSVEFYAGTFVAYFKQTTYSVRCVR